MSTMFLLVPDAMRTEDCVTDIYHMYQLYLQEARKKIEENSVVTLSKEEIAKLDEEAASRWDDFYGVHSNRFFKDRHWLFTELPELRSLESGAVLEVGCGVGNTVFPLLQTLPKSVKIFCCDFSPAAVELVRGHPDFCRERCFPFVWDVTKDGEYEGTPLGPAPGSLHVILLIFMLSAVTPGKPMEEAVRKVVRLLKPGGIIFFRDYGRYDMAQLRFKQGRSLGRDFYVRGDGTRCYFFSEDYVMTLFKDIGGLSVERFKVDKRLQVNRGKQLKMFRVWMQGMFRKPLH